MIPWTDHIPQALQQHGASRKSNGDAIQSSAANWKFQSSWINVAEDAASLTAVATPAARPSSP